jgi:M6 family metalloprotease-like protein
MSIRRLTRVLVACSVATASIESPAQSTQITGDLVALIAESFQREAVIHFSLRLEDGSTIRLLLDEVLLRPFGGVRAMDQRRVALDGVFQPELRDPATGATTRVFAVSGVRPIGPQPAYAAAAHAIGPVTGTFKWVVIGCRFGDRTTITPVPNTLWQTFLGAAAPGLDHYWREVSGGRVNLTGSVATDWFNLPQNRSYYMPGNLFDSNRLRTDCLATADAMVNFPDFDGIIFQYNDYLLAGSSTTYASFAFFTPQQITIDGQTKGYRTMFMSYGHERALNVWAHEMGHTFTLPHSSGSRAAARFPYDSYWDVMSDGAINNTTIGGTIPVHTIAYHKFVTGWITDGETAAIQPGTRTVRLEPSTQPLTAGSFRLIRVDLPDQPGVMYTAEARMTSGYDAMGSPRGLPGIGVVIHRVDTDGDLFNVNFPRATVVDGDLTNNSVNDGGAIWTAGETYTNPSDGVTFAIAAVAGQPYAYDVTVTLATRNIATLANNLPVTGISGGAGSGTFFRIAIPAGTSVLSFATNGGSGDMDIYARHGQTPTTLAYACASENVGNTDRCVVPSPAAGDWYVMLFAYSSSSNVTLTPSYGAYALQIAGQPGGAVSGQTFSQQPTVQLVDAAMQPVLQSGVSVTATVSAGGGTLFGSTTAVSAIAEGAVKQEPVPVVVSAVTAATGIATFASLGISGAGNHTLTFTSLGYAPASSQSFNVAQPAATILTPGTPISGMSGSSGTTQLFRAVVPAGTAGLAVSISGSSGDADLYVRRGGPPTTTLYDCRPFTGGSNETCTIGVPAATELYVMVRAFTSYSGVSLAANPIAQRVALQTQPAGAVSGQPFTQQPVVRLVTGDNQPIQLAGVSVTASRTSGSGSLSGTPLTATTDASGIATFSGLRLSGSGAHTLLFSATAYGGALSDVVMVAPAGLVVVAGLGDGAGTVSAPPVSCNYANNASTGTCVGTFGAGSTATFTATTSSESVFLGWSGATCTGAAPCQLVVNGTYGLKAYFANRTRILDGVVDELFGGPPTVSAVERAHLDAGGNRSGSLDLGDLLAMIDRSGVPLSAAILELLATPAPGAAKVRAAGRIKR